MLSISLAVVLWGPAGADADGPGAVLLGAGAVPLAGAAVPPGAFWAA